MKIWVCLWVATLVAVLLLAGCLHPVNVIVEKRCEKGWNGGFSCTCRDKETGRFVVCPPEWKER